MTNWTQLLALAIFCAGLSNPVSADDTTTDGRDGLVQGLLKRYCYDCHGDGASEGNLTLDRSAGSAQAAEEPELWWKVLKNVRSGVMPPVDADQPTAEEIRAIADWVKFDVFGINSDDPDPGRLTVRRLNRTEYGHTINDLMGIRFDVKLLFPADDSGHGFDNVGDALSFSPLLMEKYLKAARAVVAEAVPTQTKVVPLQVVRNGDFRDRNGKQGEGSYDGKQEHRLSRIVKVGEAGQYNVDVAIKLHGSFDFDPARYVVTFLIDGEQRFRNEYGWDENKVIRFHYDQLWDAGDHELVFELTPVASETPEATDDARRNDSTYVRFEIASARVEGPIGTDNLLHPPNYERFFSRDAPPQSSDDRRAYAAEVLGRFASRAFRSDVAADTVERLVDLAEAHYSQPDVSFEAGIAQAMVAVLASPRFLFHLEAAEPETDIAYGPVDEVALASRLSYFLWSTMPDDELVELARAGKLRSQLPQQVRRMMADERSERLLDNFVGQWLRTRDVSQTVVDPLVVLGFKKEYDEILASFRSRFGRRRRGEERSPEDQKRFDRFRELRELSDRFDASLKRAMQQETELSVAHLVREDGSLLDLIDCDYTFLNEQLARHYKIPDVQGREMRRVELPEDSPRGGVLTQASMLLVTSNPTRTSPVKRGLFILDNILGTPAPPAPAAVPNLEDSASRFGDREPTLRELLQVHREEALCASCHNRMDPLGLALENFDALGMWREAEGGQPIDASGTLITGESFANIVELKQTLRENHASDFYRCVTEKLLTYALGRGIEYTDQHAIDLIVEDLEQGGGKFSILLQGIVQSAPFQKQRFRVSAD